MPKRVAIIGAGPTGLGVAKAIGLEPNAFEVFSKIDVYERSPEPGGLWYYTGAKKTLVTPNVPAPDLEHQGETFAGKKEDAPKSISAMYENLETNIPKDLMEYKDLPFLPESSDVLFPARSQVLDYIQLYAKTVPKNVNFLFDTNVTSLTKKSDVWELVSEGKDGASTTTEYDDVILAQGHFDATFIPDVPGLDVWAKKDPAAVTHAKYFVNVEPYRGKSVLVVGNSASGTDIATQLITTAKTITMSSSTDDSPFKDVIKTNVDQIGRVVKYDFDDNRSVTTEDGTKVEGIDAIIFCTGYLHHIPFLKSYKTGPEAIITDGTQIRYVYKQIFYIPDPSLILVAIQQNIIPFPLSESQGQVIARVLSGRITLPSKEEMLKSYNEELERKGAGKQFHALKTLQDVDYYNELSALIADTEDEGFVARKWGDAKKHRRETAMPLKVERLKKIVAHTLKLKEEGKPFELLGSEDNE